MVTGVGAPTVALPTRTTAVDLSLTVPLGERAATGEAGVKDWGVETSSSLPLMSHWTPVALGVLV